MTERVLEVIRFYQGETGNDFDRESFDIAIKELELLDRYRSIGTVDKFCQLSEQLKPHVADETSCPERRCNKCDKYRKENEKYHEVGTVEECREARERQRAKKLVKYDNCGNKCAVERCPVCFEAISGNYCEYCGQRVYSVELRSV